MAGKYEDTVIRFDRIHERGGRTDRQTDRHRTTARQKRRTVKFPVKEGSVHPQRLTAPPTSKLVPTPSHSTTNVSPPRRHTKFTAHCCRDATVTAPGVSAGWSELGVAARHYLDGAASATNWRRSSYLRRRLPGAARRRRGRSWLSSR